MILNFADVITPEEHQRLLAISTEVPFIDGRQSAGARLSATKNNEQVAEADEAMHEVKRLVAAALLRHEAFKGSTLPRHIHSLRFSRYRAGMFYGPHIDSAVLYDKDRPFRADVSFTLFLSDPAAYDGGELGLETGSGEVSFKLPARALISYPTGQLHQVLPITRGERLVVVGWVQSYVRDADQRELLWDLSVSISHVFEALGKSRPYDLLVKSHANLLRRWSEI